MDTALDLTLARDFAIALLIGALVGLEREKTKAMRGTGGTTGIRTFILFALLGAVSAWLSKEFDMPWIFVSTLTGVSAMVVAGYVVEARQDPEGLGMTTEIASIGVCLLGGAAALGYTAVAVALAIVASATLAFKEPIHGLVGKLDREDIYAGLKLLIATFIVLPVLPNRVIDPWQALNPYRTWLLVILISTLSLVGYVMTRWLGTGRGLAVSGLTGGLVSSTAVTLAFAKQSREQGVSATAGAALASAIVLAWTVMFGRVVVEVAIVNASLLPRLLVPFVIMGVAAALTATLFHLQGRRHNAGKGRPSEVPLKNPFSLTSAMKFALFFTAVLFVVKLAQHSLAGQGLYLVAALAGLTDMDAISLSMADYAKSGGDARMAVAAITIAALTNTLVKAGLVVALGGAVLRLRTLLAAGVVVACGVAVLLFV